MIEVKIKKSKDSVTPEYKTAGSAGLDLVINNFQKVFQEVDILDGGSAEECTNLSPKTTSIELQPFDRVLVGTGLKMEIPKGYELQIRPRSGLAINSGITVLNSPGTIDSDYRGEIGVILINTGAIPVAFNKGDRCAQGVFTTYESVRFVEEAELSETTRGDGGFGSTGKND